MGPRFARPRQELARGAPRPLRPPENPRSAGARSRGLRPPSPGASRCPIAAPSPSPVEIADQRAAGAVARLWQAVPRTWPAPADRGGESKGGEAPPSPAPLWVQRVCGSSDARITAGNRLKSYGTARSAFPAVEWYPIVSRQIAGKNGIKWREDRVVSGTGAQAVNLRGAIFHTYGADRCRVRMLYATRRAYLQHLQFRHPWPSSYSAAWLPPPSSTWSSSRPFSCATEKWPSAPRRGTSDRQYRDFERQVADFADP